MNPGGRFFIVNAYICSLGHIGCRYHIILLIEMELHNIVFFAYRNISENSPFGCGRHQRNGCGRQYSPQSYSWASAWQHQPKAV